MDCTGFHTLYLPSTALVYSLMSARANIPLEISEPEIEGISTVVIFDASALHVTVNRPL